MCENIGVIGDDILKLHEFLLVVLNAQKGLPKVLVFQLAVYSRLYKFLLKVKTSVEILAVVELALPADQVQGLLQLHLFAVYLLVALADLLVDSRLNLGDDAPDLLVLFVATYEVVINSVDVACEVLKVFGCEFVLEHFLVADLDRLNHFPEVQSPSGEVSFSVVSKQLLCYVLEPLSLVDTQLYPLDRLDKAHQRLRQLSLNVAWQVKIEVVLKLKYFILVLLLQRKYFGQQWNFAFYQLEFLLKLEFTVGQLCDILSQFLKGDAMSLKRQTIFRLVIKFHLDMIFQSSYLQLILIERRLLGCERVLELIFNLLEPAVQKRINV